MRKSWIWAFCAILALPGFATPGAAGSLNAQGVAPRYESQAGAATKAGAANAPTPVFGAYGGAVTVPQQVIQNRHAVSVCDALRTVSGVTC